MLQMFLNIPVRYWFCEKPRLIKEHRGGEVDNLIAAVDKATHNYPWETTYMFFPAPNSNFFTAWIAKHVPDLELDLPFSAIGSGYVKKS